MKSVTIKDLTGKILIKIIHRKSGRYDVEKYGVVTKIVVEIRDENGRKTLVDI